MSRAIEHLRIRGSNNNKLLQAVTFNNLLPLNLLAGKNGAGKSTVLAALAKQSNESSIFKDVFNRDNSQLRALDWLGRIFDESEIDKIWLQMVELSTSEKRSAMNELPRDVGVLSDLKDWFKESVAASSKPQFMPEVFGEFSNKSQGVFDVKRPGIKTFRYSEIQPVQAELEAFFRKSLSCVLIPPRRELSNDAKNGTAYQFLPSGIGLVNRLFELKSSSRNSEEWKRYQRLLVDFKRITGGVMFDVVLHTDQTLHVEFGFGKSPSWINSLNTGTGFANVLILLYWISQPNLDLVLVEEPENHLHPMLLNNIASYVSELTDRVVIMATHSSHLISAPVEKNFLD